MGIKRKVGWSPCFCSFFPLFYDSCILFSNSENSTVSNERYKMSKKITHKNLKSLLSLGYLNSFFQNLFISWYVAEEFNREGEVSEVTMASAFLSG